jgi:hypothetical protein
MYMKFSERLKLADEVLAFCDEHEIAQTPMGIISALYAMGYEVCTAQLNVKGGRRNYGTCNRCNCDYIEHITIQCPLCEGRFNF